MPKTKIILFGVLILAAILALDVFFEVNFPKINEVEIKSGKITEGEIRIVQISDLHNKNFFGNNESLYGKIKNSNPDFVVITGDLIDKNTKDYSYAYGFAEELLKINSNVYYVAGDHEQKNTRDILKGLAERGVKVLDKSNAVFKKNGQTINIFGVDYYADKNDISFIKQIPDEVFSVLLAHNPDLAIESSGIKADLILSGDTHGGQVRLPIIGAIKVPGQPLFPKYTKGLYKLENGSLLYIDSGLGNTFFPARFLNRSQISLITITGN
ncbi:MAG: metallophosphoesterase [Candidatus Pacebacteria bacterium]|nr:metallophosphoesterase [Candidatus Paceibacterota bacterium]